MDFDIIVGPHRKIFHGSVQPTRTGYQMQWSSGQWGPHFLGQQRFSSVTGFKMVLRATVVLGASGPPCEQSSAPVTGFIIVVLRASVVLGASGPPYYRRAQLFVGSMKRFTQSCLGRMIRRLQFIKGYDYVSASNPHHGQITSKYAEFSHSTCLSLTNDVRIGILILFHENCV